MQSNLTWRQGHWSQAFTSLLMNWEWEVLVALEGSSVFSENILAAFRKCSPWDSPDAEIRLASRRIASNLHANAKDTLIFRNPLLLVAYIKVSHPKRALNQQLVSPTFSSKLQILPMQKFVYSFNYQRSNGFNLAVLSSQNNFFINLWQRNSFLQYLQSAGCTFTQQHFLN